MIRRLNLMRIILSILLSGCFLSGFSYASEETEYLEQALKTDPDNFGIYYGLGLAYYADKQYEKVIECHKKFTQLTSYPEAYRNLERAYRKIGDYAKAREYSQKAVDYERNKNSVRTLMPLAPAARDAREIEALGKMLQINPNLGSLYANLSQDTISKASLEREIGFLEQALKINPDNFGIYYGLGIAYYKNEEYDKAIECCLKFTRANPTCALTYYGLGVAYYNTKDTASALEQLMQLKRIGSFELAGKLEALMAGEPYQDSNE